jgi:hypothetical protein
MDELRQRRNFWTMTFTQPCRRARGAGQRLRFAGMNPNQPTEEPMSEDTNGIPEGFAPLADPEADVPNLTIIEAEGWRKGRKVVNRGLREWKSGRGELHRAHAFSYDGDDSGALYGAWSTAVLDRLLAQVSIGETVFLRYDGLVPHPKLAEGNVHKWTVAHAVSEAPSLSK